MKKWWWFPFAYMFDVSMLNVVLQNAWVLYHINKDEVDESLPLLACNFQMYVMRWHIIRCHPKKKACVRCAKITSDAAQ